MRSAGYRVVCDRFVGALLSLIGKRWITSSTTAALAAR
jgi:hypothetical protein